MPPLLKQKSQKPGPISSRWNIRTGFFGLIFYSFFLSLLDIRRRQVKPRHHTDFGVVYNWALSDFLRSNLLDLPSIYLYYVYVLKNEKAILLLEWLCYWLTDLVTRRDLRL